MSSTIRRPETELYQETYGTRWCDDPTLAQVFHPVCAAVVPCRWRRDYRCPTPAKCRYGHECEARPTMQDAARIQRLLDEDVARLADAILRELPGMDLVEFDREAAEAWAQSRDAADPFCHVVEE